MAATARSDKPNDTPDLATRDRVIEAAIDCVIELGLYRASTNAIAKRAGVTWGVIQHHFGNRERLMLAAFERGIGDLRDLLSDSKIEGATIQERLASFAEIMDSFFSSPRYLALLQIQLNLTADPSTSQTATDYLRSMTRAAGPLIDALIQQVFEGAVGPEPELYQLIFFATRGLSMSRAVNASLPPSASELQRPVDWAAQQHLLVQGLDAVYKDLAVKGAARRRKG